LIIGIPGDSVPDETIEKMEKKYKPFEKWELDVK
jgi:hypothetical protein